MQTVEILYKIDEYLNGLNNIVMEDDVSDKMCESPNYGHFVVVINKMMGDASDEQLYLELMTPEPDYIPGYEERNEIRNKLTDCFDGISVHGLPVLNIESGQEIDYPILDERFKGGLAAIANVILEKSPVPRTVTVGGMTLELNSTTAEVIIETVIEEANEGKIDLTGFQSFWRLVVFQVENELFKSQEDLDISLPLCTGIKSKECSTCACSFRNDVVRQTFEKINNVIVLASQQAQDMFGEDVSGRVSEMYEAEIKPWMEENICSSNQHVKSKSDQHCDFSEMTDGFVTPNSPIRISCEFAFICGSLSFDGTNITINANKVYFAENTNIDVLAPPKASNGIDGELPGSEGGRGTDGAFGSDLFLTSNALMRGSEGSFIFTSTGGDGGNGGQGGVGETGTDGKDGEQGSDGIPGIDGKNGADITEIDDWNDPQTADQVCAQPGKLEIEYKKTKDEHHCVCSCHETDWWRRYEYKFLAEETGKDGEDGTDGTNATPGGDGENGGSGGPGGRGGDGGNGGKAGDVRISGANINPIVNQIGGKGGLLGQGGRGGPGGQGGKAGQGGVGGAKGEGGAPGVGTSQERYFYCKHYHDESCDCGSWLVGCGENSPWNHMEEFSTAHHGYIPCCNGHKGTDGSAGKDGQQGLPGLQGIEGPNGENGQNGIDA